ncbi:MAG TPA: hypothetical protein VMU95_40575, partial [Trebonia sp.]|nr:hypothetical protein [Trebonia sp.]
MSLNKRESHLSDEEMLVTIGGLVGMPPASVRDWVLLAIADGQPIVVDNMLSPEHTVAYVSTA